MMTSRKNLGVVYYWNQRTGQTQFEKLMLVNLRITQSAGTQGNNYLASRPTRPQVVATPSPDRGAIEREAAAAADAAVVRVLRSHGVRR